MVADGTIPPRTDPASISEQDQPSFAEVGQNLGAAWAAALHYLSAQLARLRAAFRNFLLLSVLGVFGALVAVTVLISSTVLLVIGVAGAISSALGGRQWAGDLIVGVTVLGGAALVGFIVIKKMIAALASNRPRKPSSN